jgi:hypothetical protein
MAEANERGLDYDKWADASWNYVVEYEDPTKWIEMSAEDEEGEVYELPPPPEVMILHIPFAQLH